MTGLSNMDPSHLTLSAIQHPILRLTLKLFATSLFGRADHSLSRMNEVQFLGIVLLPEEPKEFQDFAVALVHHLSSVSTAAKSAAIWVGGVLTRLACKHGFVEPAQLPADTLLSNIFLRNAGYMGPLASQTWNYNHPDGPPLTITFPYNNLPLLTPNQVDYLLPNEVVHNEGAEEEPEYEDDEEEDDAYEGDALGPSVPHSAGYPYALYEQHMQQLLQGQQARPSCYDPLTLACTPYS